MFSFAKSFQSRVFSSADSANAQGEGGYRLPEGWDQLVSEDQKLLSCALRRNGFASHDLRCLWLLGDPGDGSLAGIVTESDIVRGRRTVQQLRYSVMCYHDTKSNDRTRNSSDPADSPMSFESHV